MKGVFIDTPIFIDSIRKGDVSIFSRRRFEIEDHSFVIFLSAVVLQELHAGATDRQTRRLLAKLEDAFEKAGRLLVPELVDWRTTGQILLKIGRKHGFEMIGRSRMTNDCLVAMTARRLGLILITRNTKDFSGRSQNFVRSQ